MVSLGGTYTADPNNVQGDYTPLPVGDYRVHVVDSDMKENTKRNGSYLQLELEVLDGEHAGRKLTERLNIDNPNQQAVDIAQRTLNAICVAIGKLSISDSSELHNIPMIASVKVDPAKPYMKDGIEYPGSPQNSIKAYKPVGGSGFASGGTAGAASSSAAPANSNSSPPWKRTA